MSGEKKEGASPPLVAVVMGSRRDGEFMEGAMEVLDRFGIPFEIRVLSAHRDPESTRRFAVEAMGRGVRFIIAGAGMAAHLPGFMASATPLPVLGVPLPATLMGIDSLLSMVQMPAGLPVATFGMGKAGAKNAALFVVRALALHDPTLLQLLEEYLKGLKEV